MLAIVEVYEPKSALNGRLACDTARVEPNHSIRQTAAQAILVRISTAISDEFEKHVLNSRVGGLSLIESGLIKPVRASSSSSRLSGRRLASDFWSHAMIRHEYVCASPGDKVLLSQCKHVAVAQYASGPTLGCAIDVVVHVLLTYLRRPLIC